MPETVETNTAGFIFNRFISRLNGAGVIWIFAIMFLICADIAGRNLFDNPITGVPEMASLSLVAAVFLQLANAIHHNRLTSTEFFRHSYAVKSPDFLKAWQLVMTLSATVVMFFMALGAWSDFVRAFATNEFAGVESVFTITVWPVKFIIVLGAAVTALEYCRQIYHGLGAGKGLKFLPLLKAFLLPVVVFGVLFMLWTLNAEPRVVGVFMIALALILIAMGMPIAISLLLTGFLGLAVLKQDFTIATRTLSLAAEGTVSEYVFATVPLFVLMGLFVNVADIGRDAFRAAQKCFGWIKGGLGVATVAANAVFAAITGISIASAAIFSKIAVPELVRHGYTKRFAVGLTAGSSVLGMLIPPSLLLIIYGVIAEVSIGDLFIAAIIPGIILACCFAAGVLLMAFFAPGFVGDIKGETINEENADGPAWPGLLAVVVLVVVVLGGIYGGIFTPTEAGAAGALVAMLIALVRGKLDKGRLWEVMQEAGQVSVSILFLIICASIFSMMLTLTELPQVIAAILGDSSLGLAGFLVIYLALLIILGTVLDSTSIMLILLPLALPVVAAMGENLVWFGIITVIGIEIGLLTPPLGLSVYVIKASVDDDSISLGMIFSGALPFVFITLLVTIVLMVFPELSLFLIK
ncbi:TRAP transporter large permease subunit [Gammaproteobacteria bacterium]|nr:TRAP transporter large permease subunit [Gammaproteobacteria bacterium]